MSMKSLKLRAELTIAAAACVAGWSALAWGESSSSVAGSGMSQGSGAITTRSDVEVAVESLKGTSRARLGAVGKAISSKLSGIRSCYAEVTSKRPTKEGFLRIEVRVPEGSGRTKVTVADDEVGDRELTGCVVKTLESADYSGIRGPAGGLVVVDMANTAAQGARMVAQERANPSAAQVEQTEDGHPRVSATTSGGEVGVTITGRGQTSAEAVIALHRAVQGRIGLLLDCRRRASRRGMNPAGEVVLAFTVNGRGVARGRRISSNIADTMTPQRLINALRQATRGERSAAGSYRISVVFAGNGS